ncbi:hypothetical protein FOL47_007528 [Perkinsus chesapeaki]|uniref:Pseudouridine synthase RsuA/RluA-like domain-containing protein n=1 Tax=Perkinsus chesapeaki TaxID=330153 RepID=A0A7J6LKH4_PERCH|nr:hypothetical protein FOL47_007528 [Perkinsus chesapeaki]
MDKFRLANQLDFATSGAVVVTLNKTADRETSALFQFRLTKKLYIAVGDGWVDEDELMKARLITEPIAAVEGEFRMEISDKGQPSSTIAVPVINTYCGGDVKCTVFVLRLLTGRRHQLRYVNHPTPEKELLEEAAHIALNYTRVQTDTGTPSSSAPPQSSEHVNKKAKH